MNTPAIMEHVTGCWSELLAKSVGLNLPAFLDTTAAASPADATSTPPPAKS